VPDQPRAAWPSFKTSAARRELGASVLKSIEKKYGRPIDHWLTLVAELKEMRHMEQVAFLKSEHGLGHGHANAIVAHVLASRTS
jgi:hypothetical protein